MIKGDDKMKIYISGAITGVKEYEFNFLRAHNDLKLQGMNNKQIKNPCIFTNHLPQNSTWEQYMRVCVKELADCDKIYMLKGWENSRGATEEHRIAKMLGMEVIYE